MFFVIFLLPLILGFSLAFPQTNELNEDIFENCKINEGATAEDFKWLLEGKIPELRIEKCISACLMEDLGVVKIEFLFKIINFY